jgi:hypothetical protein
MKTWVGLSPVAQSGASTEPQQGCRGREQRICLVEHSQEASVAGGKGQETSSGSRGTRSSRQHGKCEGQHHSQGDSTERKDVWGLLWPTLKS